MTMHPGQQVLNKTSAQQKLGVRMDGPSGIDHDQ